jgi:hypothetical protein
MTLTLTGRYNATALMDELLDAFPAWRGTPVPPDHPRARAGGCVNPHLSVQWQDDTVWLEFPDDAEIGVVRAVIAAHDPTKEDRSARWAREQRQALARLKADPEQTDLLTALGR